jgi:hypothetical protein
MIVPIVDVAIVHTCYFNTLNGNNCHD